MIIEKMTINDVQVVMGIERKLSTTQRTSKDWQSVLQGENVVQFFVGKDGDEIVGYYEAYFGVETAEVYFLAVDPERQNRGYGKGLLDHLIKMVENNQCSQLILEVRKSNIKAQSLYQGRGFIIVGVREKYYRLPSEDALVMCKKLINKNRCIKNKNAK